MEPRAAPQFETRMRRVKRHLLVKAMNLQILQELALLLLYPLALAGGVYAYCLWRLVLALKKRLDDLHTHCHQVHHLGGPFLEAHRVEHQSLWEALHHHEHGPRQRSGRSVKIIGHS
jgi:hypothetical protein